MRALVAGGAGQIGSHLCQLLLDAGHDVICCDNLSTGTRGSIDRLSMCPRFTFWECDVTQPLGSTPELDAVYHLASPASPMDFEPLALEILAANSMGTQNLLELAGRHGARFLFASTSEIYGEPIEHPQREEYWGNVNPNGVRSCYDEGKRFGEALTMAWVRSRALDARIVRIFNTYGPHSRADDGRLVPNFISQALRGEPFTIYGSGTQTRSICYVEDTAEGIRRTLQADLPPGTFLNIGSPVEYTVEDLARKVAAICEVEFQTVRKELPPDDPSRRCPSIDRARALLNWEPTWTVEAGLQVTVAWFRQHMAEAALR